MLPLLWAAGAAADPDDAVISVGTFDQLKTLMEDCNSKVHLRLERNIRVNAQIIMANKDCDLTLDGSDQQYHLDANNGNHRILKMTNGTLTVRSVAFKNTDTNIGYSGGCVFIYNYKEGGHEVKATFEDSKFYNCKARNGAGAGGAVKVTNAQAYFYRCDFEDNMAAYLGGAVNVEGEIVNGGGGVGSHYAAVYVTGCTWKNNKSTKFGIESSDMYGAIYGSLYYDCSDDQHFDFWKHARFKLYTLLPFGENCNSPNQAIDWSKAKMTTGTPRAGPNSVAGMCAASEAHCKCADPTEGYQRKNPDDPDDCAFLKVCQPGYIDDGNLRCVACGSPSLYYKDKYYTNPGFSCETAECTNAASHQEYQDGIHINNQCTIEDCALPLYGYVWKGMHTKGDCTPDSCPNQQHTKQYYTTQNSCELALCDNAQADEEYSKAGIYSPNNKCEVKKCGEDKSPDYGYEFESTNTKGDCTVVSCPNQQQTTQYYPTKGSCARESCNNAKPGEEYSMNGTWGPNQCPTRNCAAPPVDYKFLDENTAGDCAQEKCPQEPNRYYTGRVPGECDSEPCDNAAPGEEYFQPGLYSLQTKCPVRDCAKPPEGRSFVIGNTAGDCAKEECPQEYNRYYTGRVPGACDSEPCDNAAPGEEYYQPGLYSFKTKCPVRDCAKPPEGRSFVIGNTAGDCNTVQDSEETEEVAANDDTGLIVGVIMGVLVLILLIIFLLWFCMYKRRRQTALPKMNVVAESLYMASNQDIVIPAAVADDTSNAFASFTDEILPVYSETDFSEIAPEASVVPVAAEAPEYQEKDASQF